MLCWCECDRHVRHPCAHHPRLAPWGLVGEEEEKGWTSQGADITGFERILPATNSIPRHVPSASSLAGPASHHRRHAKTTASCSFQAQFFLRLPWVSLSQPLVRTQETLLPQSWNICVRKEGISSFQGLCFACEPVLFCLWTSSIARFVNAWQKQTNSDLPWKWHVWKIMSKSMETMGEKLGHKTGYQLCTNWTNYSAGEVFCYCFISFGLLMVFFLFWLTKNCSREKSFIFFFNILAVLRVYLLIHLSSGPNEIYFLCFMENIQTFSWFNDILWSTFVNK